MSVSQQKDLVFMRVLGVWFFFGVISGLLSLAGVEVGRPVLCTLLRSMPNVCLIEMILQTFLCLIVGIGLFRRRKWGRTVYLSLLPYFVAYWLVAAVVGMPSASMHARVAQVAALLLLNGAGIIYFMREGVKRKLEVKLQ